MPGNPKERPGYVRGTRPPSYVNVPAPLAYAPVPDALVVTMIRIVGLCWTNGHRHTPPLTFEELVQLLDRPRTTLQRHLDILERDWPVAGASVVLSGTDKLLHEKTDAVGQAGFTLLPEFAEPYQLLVEKPGFAGASSQLPVRIITDTVAPPLTIILPELTNRSLLIVTGMTEPDAELVVQGGSVSLDAEGRFSTTLALSEGENLIEAAATDGAGNTTTESGTVALDTVPPSLLVTAPLDATTVETETVQVVGSTQVDAQVVVNDGIVAVEPDGSFTMWILLSPGSNPIAVLARDPAGNETTETRTVTYRVPGSEYEVYLPLVLRNHQ